MLLWIWTVLSLQWVDMLSRLAVALLFHAVYNLTNNVDVENTKLRMEQYQRENRDVIQRNKAKLVRTSEFSPSYTHNGL